MDKHHSTWVRAADSKTYLDVRMTAGFMKLALLPQAPLMEEFKPVAVEVEPAPPKAEETPLEVNAAPTPVEEAEPEPRHRARHKAARA